MTDAERDKTQELRESLIQLATEITAIWPQTTEDNQPIYLFAGSFAVDLLALAQTCVENSGEPVPLSFRDQLKPFLRKVGDIDTAALIPERSPNSQNLPYEEAQRLGKLTKKEMLTIDTYPEVPGEDKYYKVVINTKEYLVDRLDVIVAAKLISALTNFKSKPEILNKEIPPQTKLAIETYGEERVWELIRQTYQKELNVWSNGPDWMTIGYKVRELLESETVSSELKELVKKAADLAGVDYQSVELDDDF